MYESTVVDVGVCIARTTRRSGAKHLRECADGDGVETADVQISGHER
jgi:hypothetical protein